MVQYGLKHSLALPAAKGTTARIDRIGQFCCTEASPGIMEVARVVPTTYRNRGRVVCAMS